MKGSEQVVYVVGNIIAQESHASYMTSNKNNDVIVNNIADSKLQDSQVEPAQLEGLPIIYNDFYDYKGDRINDLINFTAPSSLGKSVLSGALSCE